MSRAARYDATGGPEVLRLDDVPVPVPGAGKVVVRVAAAGINPYDAKVRSGLIGSTAPFPRRIGSDLAGTVEAVGEGAAYADGTPIGVGDQVLGRGAGTIAERAVASASALARRPAGLPIEVAGGLNVAGLTAVSVVTTVPVGPGDVVLVGGATGAVGLVAAQLARRAGARVIGTASARHHAFLRSLGVEPVAYGDALAARVGALTPGATPGVTAVFDCHGEDALDAGVALGVDPGRMVGIAAGARLGEIGAHEVEHGARTAAALGVLADRIAAGEIVLPVAETYALADVVEAFRALDRPHSPGKIVVLP